MILTQAIDRRIPHPPWTFPCVTYQIFSCLEAALAAARKPTDIEPFTVSAERFLRDLRETLETNTEKARRLLARAVDRIVQQREGTSHVAYFYGNLAGVLQIDDRGLLTDRAGAGRGISSLVYWPMTAGTIW